MKRTKRVETIMEDYGSPLNQVRLGVVVLLVLLLSIASGSSTEARTSNKYDIVVTPDQVYDSDTIMDVNFILPFDIRTTKTLRLLYVDGAEVRGKERPQGLIARDWLRAKIKVCPRVSVSLHGADAFGRELSILYCNKTNINRLMIKEGIATIWKK